MAAKVLRFADLPIAAIQQSSNNRGRMLRIRRELILLVILLPPAAAPQFVAPKTDAPSISPPPPPPPQAPMPVTPQRIRVGGAVQAVYLGPQPRWAVVSSTPMSEPEIAAHNQSLSVNPEDICTRARLIAFVYPTLNSQTANRIDHLLWMIQHHPEWEGFILAPSRGLAEPRSDEERASYHRLKQAWLEQVGPQQKRGIVLHNAAMFFAIREPAFATTLSQRAIAAEPDVPLYVERLGAVYANAFMPEPLLRRFNSVDTPERETFRHQAEVALLSSNDWVLVAGAFGDMQGRGSWMPSWMPADLSRLLRVRLESLTEGKDTWSNIRKLPSNSARYRGSECDASFVEQR
jgi:hypothetical protein